MLPHETPQNTEKLEVFIWKVAESQKVKPGGSSAVLNLRAVKQVNIYIF